MSPERILFLAWAAWVLSWWGAALWSAETVKRAPGQLSYRLITMAGIVLLFGFWRGRQPHLWPADPGLQWTLVGLTVLGFFFCWWARLHLGRYWSGTITRKEGHQVVDTGPYALVRHPIYTGLILAGFATAFVRASLFALTGAAVLTLAWYAKARLEEKFLRGELGAEAYDAYAARVPMLIPGLGR
jgi:protein-S-isoprenylcysteine O-methyltransferase Ste14